MIIWAICLTAKDELVSGKLYNVYGEFDGFILIELDSDYYKNFEKKLFVCDDDPSFAKILTYANIKGVLEWSEET